MEEELSRETSFPRADSALRQVTRDEGAPGPACAEPWLSQLSAGDTAVWGPVHQLSWEGWPSLGRWIPEWLL